MQKDNRGKLWSTLELKIQQRASGKDKLFKLKGPWKVFMRKVAKISIYAVDGEWVRTNLSVIFGHGGHGYVHEFIPLNEVWVATKHPNDCDCKNVRVDRDMSKAYSESTIIHETTEQIEMEKGKIYWEAHNIALEKEREAGLLKDPYTEEY